MPRYLYKCEKCEQYFEKNHSIVIKYKVCSEISEDDCQGALTRIPSFSRYIKVKSDSKTPTGELTRNTIEEARQELKEQKENLSNQEYDD